MLFLHPKQFKVNHKFDITLKNFLVPVPGHWRVYHLMDEKIKRKLNTLIKSLICVSGLIIFYPGRRGSFCKTLRIDFHLCLHTKVFEKTNVNKRSHAS